MPLTSVSQPIFASTFDTDALLDALLEVYEDATRQALDKWDDVTETWEIKPVFTVTRRFRPDEWTFTIDTDDQRMYWINYGTDPHVITPRPSNPTGLLRFPIGFTPKTTPKIASSRVGGKFGPITSRPSVNHPGVEPRRFDLVIDTLVSQTLRENVRDVVRDPRFF